MPWGSLPCRPGPCSCSPSCSLRRQLPRPVPSRDRRRRPGGTDARSHGGGASGAAPLPGASTRGSSEGAPGPRGAGTEAAGGAEAPPPGRGAGAGSAAPAQPAGGGGTSGLTRAAEAAGTDVGWTSGGAALPGRSPGATPPGVGTTPGISPRRDRLLLVDLASSLVGGMSGGSKGMSSVRPLRRSGGIGPSCWGACVM